VKIELFTKILPDLLKKLSQNVSHAELQPWIADQLRLLGDNPKALLQNALEVWFERQLGHHPSDADLLLSAKDLLEL
jgi:hypothetical protein